MKASTIIVSGMVAADPYQGGASWAVLQYLLGLRRAGYDAYLIEPMKATAIQPRGASFCESDNAAYFRSLVTDLGIEDCSTLLLDNTRETVGLSYVDLLETAQRADLLLNVSGMLQRDELVAHIPVRLYLDLDPAFNQLWHATQGIDVRFGGHTHFASVGTALGTDKCSIPTCGVDWIKTLPPIGLEYYSTDNPIHYDGFTTVGNWRGYGSIDHNGVFYGQKAHSFRQFIDLPLKTSETFTVALSIDPGEDRDLEALSRNRWNLVKPIEVADSPRHYMNFIRTSKAELGMAKSGYVVSKCGWFSDRSASYLAFGRPVVAQETGFSSFLPCGAGLFRFRVEDEILAAIETISSDYARQSRTARDIAIEYFDAAKVLSRLLAAVGVE